MLHQRMLLKLKFFISRFSKSEMLGIPYTFPDTGFAYELLSVVEDHNDDCKMHVVIAGSFDYAESWGKYLADVARVIARDYADDLSTMRNDGNLLAAMYEGFTRVMLRNSAE